jgi:hypothetical protein
MAVGMCLRVHLEGLFGEDGLPGQGEAREFYRAWRVETIGLAARHSATNPEVGETDAHLIHHGHTAGYDGTNSQIALTANRSIVNASGYSEPGGSQDEPGALAPGAAASAVSEVGAGSGGEAPSWPSTAAGCSGFSTAAFSSSEGKMRTPRRFVKKEIPQWVSTMRRLAKPIRKKI